MTRDTIPFGGAQNTLSVGALAALWAMVDRRKIMSLWKLLYRLEGSPAHCKACGKLFLVERTPVKFDKHTGEPKKIKVVVKCPSFNGFDGHYYTHWIERLAQEDRVLLEKAQEVT